MQLALRLAGATLAEAEQAAKPGIGGAIGRVDEQVAAIGEDQPAADDQPDAGDLGGLMRPDDARQRVAVGDRQRMMAAHRGLREQLLGRRRAAQEREVRRALELSIAA